MIYQYSIWYNFTGWSCSLWFEISLATPISVYWDKLFIPQYKNTASFLWSHGCHCAPKQNSSRWYGWSFRADRQALPSKQEGNYTNLELLSIFFITIICSGINIDNFVGHNGTWLLWWYEGILSPLTDNLPLHCWLTEFPLILCMSPLPLRVPSWWKIFQLGTHLHLV